jgi:hypothetical protein
LYYLIEHARRSRCARSRRSSLAPPVKGTCNG